MGYKALQNKVFHRGAYLEYRVSPDGDRYTTNGSIMVLGEVDVKTVKGQIDARGNVVKAIPNAMWEHMQESGALTYPKDFEILGDGNVLVRSAIDKYTLEFDSEYIDYLIARAEVDWPNPEWYVDNKVLTIVDIDNADVLAMLAPIIRKDKDNE